MIGKIIIASAAITLLALSSACGIDANGADSDGNDEPRPTAPAGATPPVTGTRVIPAPILETELIIRESFPVQYAVKVVSELPNGCHQFDGVTQSRNDTALVIDVTNTVPDDPNPICTQIYGTHEEIVDIGSDFVSGTEYTVQVNDKTLVFRAQ